MGKVVTSKKMRFARLRQRARRKLGILMKDQHDKCLFCRDPIVRIKKVNVIKKTWNLVTYKLNGRIYINKFATVEHLIPLSKGGNNSKGNLVACCMNCNLKQNEKYTIMLKKPCRICNSVFYTAGKICQSCKNKRSENYQMMFLGRS